MNKTSASSRSRMSRAIYALLCLLVMLAPAGCKDSEIQPQQPPEPAVVYDDGVYLVERTECLYNADEQMTLLCLRVTNNSTRSTAISSVLGVRVTSAGQPCQLIPTEKPLDGLLDAGESKEGWIKVKFPVQPDSFTVEIALDYLEDQWVSFTVSL